MTPTPRPLPRSRLGNLIPTLVESQALVVLVPASGDLRWAAEAAWDVARAAVHQDRRVALVDLWIEEPTLHEVVGLTPSDGIVDAFEYGVSLNKAAHEVNGVFFIAAGSYSPNAGEVLGHERWRKLHAGFRSEGALLLLFISPGGLARLAAVPDGLIVLAPDGFEPESSIGQGIIAATERGVPMLGVVRERWTPSPTAAFREPLPAGRPSGGLRRPSAPRRRAARPVVVAATLAAGAAGGWGLLTHSTGDPRTTPPPTAAPRSAVAAPAPPPAPLPPPPPPPTRTDTLAWTVQLVAYSNLERALTVVDRLRRSDGVDAFVTSVPLGRGTVWYRVLAGTYPTRDSATAARLALWDHKVVPKGRGDVLRAPYSLALPAYVNPDSLRSLGITVVRGGKNSAPLVGAFESSEQASLMQAQLTRAGIHATLVTRVEITP